MSHLAGLLLHIIATSYIFAISYNSFEKKKLSQGPEERFQAPGTKNYQSSTYIIVPH